MTKISNADARADLRRLFRWQRFLSGLVLVVVFAIAMRQLGQVDLEASDRVLWLLLPLLGLVWVIREQRAHHRRMDEFHRTINARTAEIVWPLTLAWLAFVALLATAFGFPFAIPVPFGLPPDEFGWIEVLLVPLLMHMVVFVLVHKRFSGQR